MKEIWKDIEEFEGIYQVSNLGRVRSVDRMIIYRTGAKRLTKGTTLSISQNKLGYLQVSLHKEDKMYSRRVHRLVAKAFIPNPNNYKEINHIDGIKENNCVDNLEWCDRTYNIKHAIDNGLRKKHYEHKKRGDTEMKRKLDKLGRVVIPKEEREELGWNENDEIQKDVILLKKHENAICKICGMVQSEKHIFCSNCGKKM